MNQTQIKTLAKAGIVLLVLLIILMAFGTVLSVIGVKTDGQAQQQQIIQLELPDHAE